MRSEPGQGLRERGSKEGTDATNTEATDWQQVDGEGQSRDKDAQ